MEARAYEHWVDQFTAPAHPIDHTIDTYVRQALHTHTGLEISSDMISQTEPADWDTQGIENLATKEVLRMVAGMGDMRRHMPLRGQWLTISPCKRLISVYGGTGRSPWGRDDESPYMT